MYYRRALLTSVALAAAVVLFPAPLLAQDPASTGSVSPPPLTATEKALALAPASSAPAQPAAPAMSVAAPVSAPPDSAPAAAPAAAPVNAVASTQSETAPVEAAPAPAPESVVAALKARLTVASTDTLRQGMAEFYATRSYQPLWVEGGLATSAAKILLARMATADEDGLDARTYAVNTAPLTGASASADQIADTEVAISAAVLSYIQHASGGRVAPGSIGRDIIATPNAPEPLVGLASIAIAANPVRVLEDYNPSGLQYQALKRKLAQLRADASSVLAAQPPVIPTGPTLKAGMSDARVAMVRTRLGLTTASDSAVYDEALVDAVKAFQKSNRMKATGSLTPLTVLALNGPTRKPRLNPESEIVANMERWRWLPRNLGDNYVFVNVPQFQARVTLNGEMVHETKVIVGKPNTPTPIFSDTMQFVVLNPSWYVPQSIIQKEYLPKLADDPDFLTRQGFEVTYVGGSVQVRQPPGDRNALGHIKFMFPNKFSVYLHDTSSRSLFGRTERALSHGCVRVDDPYSFAEIVMGAQNGWTADKVRSMVGRSEQRIDLKRQLPVHLAYFTAYVDDAGALRTLNDIYGYDRRVITALGLPLI